MQKSLDELIQSKQGIWGIHVIDPISNKAIYEHNPEEEFPAASIAKLSFALFLLAEVEKGNISLDNELTLSEEFKLKGSGVLRYLHEGLKLTYQDVLTLMIIVSDNTAGKMLVKRLDPEKINDYMKSLGFNATQIIIKEDSFEWGMTTPRECSTIIKGIYSHKYFSENLSNLLMEIMKKQPRDRIARYLPEEIKVSRKSGSIPGVRNDVGIVHTEKPYIISVLSKDLLDDSFSLDNEGSLTIAEISKLVFDFLVAEKNGTRK